MTQRLPHSSPASPAVAGRGLALPLLAGLAAALVVFAVLFFTDGADRRAETVRNSLNSLEVIQTGMLDIWDRAAVWNEHAARRLNSADANGRQRLLAIYQGLWPEADFSLYNQAGELMDSGSGGPVASSVRPLVHKALVGQSGRDVTRLGAFLGLSAAVPLRSGEARALVLTVPLDSRALQKIKTLARADVAVVPFDEVTESPLPDFAGEVHTFSFSGVTLNSCRQELAALLAERRIDETKVLALTGGLSAAVAPLENGSGLLTGVVLAVPSAKSSSAFLMWHAAVALCAGLAAASAAFFAIRRQSDAFAEAFIGAAVSLAEEEEEEAPDSRWSSRAREALERMGRAMKEQRGRIAAAATAAVEARPAAVESRPAADEEAYLRLFENAPVGVFQATADAALLRVNPAFAMLMGYDAPVQLLAENSLFTDFCLYGDEIRNPLSLLLEEGGGRQTLSLRKRDGRIGNFALVCVPLTAPDGEFSGVLECFVMDRDLEDQRAKAEREREYASRQRTSLALLLAATCRQTQNRLTLPHAEGSAPDGAEPAPTPDRRGGPDRRAGPDRRGGAAEAPGTADAAAPGAGLRPFPERRKSVTAVRAILADIYQIAMGEVTGSPPVDVPMDFERFLRRLCRQTLPALQARGVSLRCDLAADLPSRFNGPAPMLRHALQRAMLATASSTRSGWVNLGVLRDPNAPKSPGQTRVLFSVFWTPYERGENEPPLLPGDGYFLPGDGFAIAFAARVNVLPEDVLPTAADAGVLEMDNEQEIIRYLAQRMRGDLVEGSGGGEARALRLIVPLAHLDGADSAGLAEQAPFQDEKTLPGTAALVTEDGGYAPVTGPDESLRDFSVASLADANPTHLDILVAGDLADSPYPEDEEAEKERGLNILLVDDSLNNRLLFSLFLRDTRHRITEAYDGQAGVEAFQQGHFDIVFMDMEMPLMDGYQATRIIRAVEADSGREPTPVVGMTSYALPEFRRQCMLAGCTDFLSKPFSKIALFSILDAFMQLKQDDGDD